jgi:ribose transport system substrate-binding protein
MSEMSFQKLALATAAAIFSFSAAYAEGIDEISPDVVKRLYNSTMLDPAQPIGPSAYRAFAAKKPPPWTIGYASSYAGNTWRANAMDHLQKVVIPKWQKLGLIKDVIITQSNLNDSTQIQQMRQLLDQGVDAVVVCCSNATALNQTVKYGYDNGVPTFSFTGYLTSPYSINTSVNQQVAGFDIGKAMADELKGTGNVLVVEGILGTSASESQNRGVKAGLATAPDIKVVGSIAGNWTDQVAQGEVQKWLATHPGKLDGIIVQSAEVGVLRAIAQSGRPGVKVALGGELGALCSWRKNPAIISGAYQVWPPQDEIELIFDVMMRTMEGQGPKIQSILVPPILVSSEDVKSKLDESCDEQSSGWLAVGQAKWGQDTAYLDQFFLKPADPTKFKH